MNKKAIFITVEGIEGSGKSSVIVFLERFLKNKRLKVAVFREPGSTAVGEKIRDILLDNENKNLSSYTELLLYLAARTQLIEEKLIRAMSKYDFVICDRFFDSTLVYQGYGLGMGKVVEQAVKMFSFGLTPGLTFLLDTPVSKGLNRIKSKDRIEMKSLRFHRKLREGYRQLSIKYPRRIKVINARGNLGSIFKQVEGILGDYLSAL